MHDRSSYIFLTQGEHDEHGQVKVTRIALGTLYAYSLMRRSSDTLRAGDNPSEQVIMHLDTVDLEDCTAVPNINLSALLCPNWRVLNNME